MKLLAIDGNSIMNRAFYGIKLLSNSKGQFTNALSVGFVCGICLVSESRSFKVERVCLRSLLSKCL